MKRAIAVGLLAAALSLGGLGFANREALYLDYLGRGFEQRDLATLQVMLAPHLHVFPPELGAPPYPVVVQFHGCAGYRDGFMRQWASTANAEGFLAIAVDSHGPRGIDREKALARVCSGKELTGQERAGDIAAALAQIAARPDVDATRMIAAAWSHGAWSLMDLLALQSAGKAPPSIKSAASPTPLAGVAFFYPYCGPGAWSRIHAWKADRALAFVAGADTIVDGPLCKAQFDRLRAKGANIDLIYYPDAEHVFDDRTLEGDDRELFFDEETASDAERRYRALLAGVRDRQ